MHTYVQKHIALWYYMDFVERRSTAIIPKKAAPAPIFPEQRFMFFPRNYIKEH